MFFKINDPYCFNPWILARFDRNPCFVTCSIQSFSIFLQYSAQYYLSMTHFSNRISIPLFSSLVFLTVSIVINAMCHKSIFCKRVISRLPFPHCQILKLSHFSTGRTFLSYLSIIAKCTPISHINQSNILPAQNKIFAIKQFS